MNNLELMRKRLNYRGGIQQDRMIQDKYNALQKALLYSYQSCKVRKVNEKDFKKALINPNKLKPDYDDKIISINFDCNFQSGDVFEWGGTGTYWIIYLQELTEKAYFRGDIRKCSYEITWEDNGEKKKEYAAIRGPVETDLKSIQKHGISVDVPNYSLHLLMPKNEDTLKYFKRYSKFYLSNEKNVDPICWRVETVDYISMPGILEVNAEEYYANEHEDDIENGIVGGLIPEKVDPNKDNSIEGPTFIKPKKFYTYKFIGKNKDFWQIKDKKIPVILNVKDDFTAEIKWNQNYSGQFDLYYGDKVYKTIVVESLF